jgi:hypothetical protein
LRRKVARNMKSVALASGSLARSRGGSNWALDFLDRQRREFSLMVPLYKIPAVGSSDLIFGVHPSRCIRFKLTAMHFSRHSARTARKSRRLTELREFETGVGWLMPVALPYHWSCGSHPALQLKTLESLVGRPPARRPPWS